MKIGIRIAVIAALASLIGSTGYLATQVTGQRDDIRELTRANAALTKRVATIEGERDAEKHSPLDTTSLLQIEIDTLRQQMHNFGVNADDFNRFTNCVNNLASQERAMAQAQATGLGPARLQSVYC